VITYQEERLHDFLEELKPILNNHYDELSVTKSFNLNPDYDRYLKLEDLGSFFIMTCRLDGQLIGYIAYFLTYPEGKWHRGIYSLYSNKINYCLYLSLRQYEIVS